MNYGHKKVVSDNMELAEINLREVLMQNGFGVITEINIKEKLKEKLGVDFIHYKILGSCHPPSCLLYTSPSPRDRSLSRMPSSA